MRIWDSFTDELYTHNKQEASADLQRSPSASVLSDIFSRATFRMCYSCSVASGSDVVIVQYQSRIHVRMIDILFTFMVHIINNSFFSWFNTNPNLSPKRASSDLNILYFIESHPPIQPRHIVHSSALANKLLKLTIVLFDHYYSQHGGIGL